MIESATTRAVARQYDHFQTSMESLEKERKYLNYGYTEARSASFEERQERLCLEVFAAAGISADDVIVDVGFGSGEQDFLLLRTHEFAELHGYNIAERQVSYASQRAADSQVGHKLHFHHGEAESLPELAAGSVDKVLAIECAFYFDRPRFYRRAAEVLKPGGRLVLADICFSDRLAFLTRTHEVRRRVGTRRQNRAAWEEHFQTVSLREINRFTRPGAQMSVFKILRTAPGSGLNWSETRAWMSMAYTTQWVVFGLLTRLLHYDLIVLQKS
jgi:cyclopropane fatty-acyl-phospholipid synthase-like methyltransferase